MDSVDALDARIARRLASRRGHLGLTLDDLAGRSGVSRSMISKIERGEASPTAALLARLANALGLALAALFAEEGEASSPLARAAARPVWTDPETGYLRRAISPGTSPVDIAEVTLPAGAQVAYDNPVPLPVDQIVWVLDGALALDVGGVPHDLSAGDCLHMRLERRIVFRNGSRRPVRYAVLLASGAERRGG